MHLLYDPKYVFQHNEESIGNIEDFHYSKLFYLHPCNVSIYWIEI